MENTLLKVRWERVHNKVRIFEETGCHLWTGALTPQGYGSIQVKKITHLIHRIAYVLANGRLHEGDHVHHTCGNRSCCNPDHLQALSPKDHGTLHHKKIDIPEPFECKHGHQGKYKKNAQGRWACVQCQSQRDASPENKERRRAYYHKRKVVLNKIDFIDEEKKHPAHRPNHTSNMVSQEDAPASCKKGHQGHYVKNSQQRWVCTMCRRLADGRAYEKKHGRERAYTFSKNTAICC